MANSGLLLHWTLFDREYPPQLNDLFWRVYRNIESEKQWEQCPPKRIFLTMVCVYQEIE